MGVTIYAYSNVKFVKPDDEVTDEDRDNYLNLVHLYNLEPFLDRSDGLEHGAYSFSGHSEVAQHSYSGYGNWREWLAKCVGIHDIEAFWEDPDPEVPFFELLHFSDCEGFLGPKCCANLAADFEKHWEAVGTAIQRHVFPADAEEWHRRNFDEYEYYKMALSLIQGHGVIYFS